jgi:hypothetical protein
MCGSGSVRGSRLRHSVGVLGILALACLAAACGGRGESMNSSLTSGTIRLEDQGWYCGEPVDIDRLEVTVRRVDTDAIHLGRGCTGRIGEIVVVQYQKDGVKVSDGAHDLVIEKGSIECRAQKPGSHQDGVQAMGGSRITFKNLRVDCPTKSSGFFVREGGSGRELPTDIVCEGCHLLGGSYSLRVNESVRSGVRDSTICPGRFGTVKILPGAIDPVYENSRSVSC